MKTPTTLYLAYRGWFAANVPIITGIALPPALLAMPPEKVGVPPASGTRYVRPT
jgi:regulator of PEP synthase PpsR (kinase-PPPase family)